jgi:protoporphyrinogen oxidase
MPRDEWREYERDSRIRFEGYEIHHPFEANIWELPEDKQQYFLDSIALAGCNTGKEIPEKFVDWITWKLGDAIADTYMLPYNRKMFGDNLNELGIYWLDKLPNTSYEETLKSCRN